jgi:hypothetical protein
MARTLGHGRKLRRSLMLRHFLTIAVCVPSLATAQGVKPDSTGCLSQRYLVLGGVYLGWSEAQVRALLGEPASRSTGYGEDDGGRYQVIHLSYPTLQIDLGRGEVEAVASESPGVTLALGLAIGDSLSRVERHLRIPKQDGAFRAGTWAPVLCEDGELSPSLAGLSLQFEPVPGPFDPPTSPAHRPPVLVKASITSYGP